MRGVFAMAAAALFLAGCASGPKDLDMDESPYTWDYRIGSRAPDGTDVFRGHGKTHVVLPEGNRLANAWSVEDGERTRRNPDKEGPYWRLKGEPEGWILETESGRRFEVKRREQAKDGDMGIKKQQDARSGANGEEPVDAPAAKEGNRDVRPADRPCDIDGIEAKIGKLQTTLTALKESAPCAPPETGTEQWAIPFEYAEDEPGELGEAMLAHIASRAKVADRVRVWGVTTPEGSEAVNRRYGRQRAEEVAEGLKRLGVPHRTIEVEGWNADRNGLWAEVELTYAE